VRPAISENLSFETAATLIKAGIPVALQSGFEGYVPKTRVFYLRRCCRGKRIVIRRGALNYYNRGRPSTKDRPKGWIAEPGKDGDVALFDGDPFEYASHVTGVVLDGKVVSEVVH